MKAEVKSILQAISYFDIFSYPLTVEELFEFSSFKGTKAEFAILINELIQQQVLTKESDYLLPSFSSSKNIALRMENEKRAQEAWPLINKFSRKIARFPFVESICLSGSISKGVLSTDGDVDYFIITRPGRLWICRTLLVAYKKLFLLNSHKYFCVNYFISSEQLRIPDKNLFAATEVITLIPVYNYNLYQQFIEENNWVRDNFPNKPIRTKQQVLDVKPGFFKWSHEFVLNGWIGHQLDNVCFRLTLYRWKKKFPHFSMEDFDLNMRSRKTVSKHHPQGFQTKVLTALQERMKKFESTTVIT